MASWKNVPFAPQAKFCKTVAQAVLHGAKLPVYRTVDGKVQTYTLHHIGLDWGTGKMHVVYYTSDFGDLVTEPASKFDLMMIAEYAKRQIQEQNNANAAH